MKHHRLRRVSVITMVAGLSDHYPVTAMTGAVAS